MDYDDNDFQNQNFQLGGEDNTKFPPGLRSYALPKFDLDEHLQVHLRFDSLVEREILLGMQGEEDNHWIEDFSHRSSGIEFSSSAAESCSISRRNNVWSEATSSESVEMLLKSLGQDDMITKQTTIEGSDACGMDTLNNQMDPSLCPDDSLPSQKGDVVGTDSTLPSDKYLETLPGSSVDAAKDPPHVEGMPQTHIDENSGFENLVGLDMSSVGEKDESYANIAAEQCSLDQKVTSSPVELFQPTEEHLQIDEKGHEVVQGNDQLSDGSKGKISHDDHGSAASGVAGANSDNVALDHMQFVSSATSVQNLVIGVNDLNGQKFHQLVTEGCNEVVVHEKPGGLIKDDDVKVESHILGKESEIDDQQHRDPMESCTANLGNDELGNSSCSILNLDSVPQTTEGYCDVVYEKAEDMLNNDGCEVKSEISVEGTKVEVDCSGGKPETISSIIDDNETFKGELAGSSDIDKCNGSGSAVKVHSPADTIHETPEMVKAETGHENLELHASGITSDNPKSASMETKMISEVNENDIINPEVSVTASGDDMAEQVHCARDINVNSAEVHISSSLHVGSDDADIVHLDDHTLGNESSGLSTTHPDNMETVVDGSLITGKEVADSSHDQCIDTLTSEVHESSSKQNVGDESVLTGVVFKDVTGLTSFNKLEDVHQLLSGNSFDGDGVAVHKGIGMAPLPVSDFMRLDMKEEAITGVSTEPSSSVLKGNCESHPVSVPCLYSATELISETDSQSLASPEKSVHSTCQNELQVSASIKVTQEHAEVLESHFIVPSLVKEKDVSEVIGVSSESCETKALHGTGGVAKDSEIHALPVPSTVDESSHGLVQDKHHDEKASLVAGDGNDDMIFVASAEGDALNCREENSTKSVNLSKNNADSQAVEAGIVSVNDAEPNCGSPTVISSSELPQNEKEYEEGDKESIDKNNKDSPGVPSDIERQANSIKSTAQDPKGNYVSEDDRSFTFEVASLADVSERESGKGWKPFSDVQPFESPQTEEKTPTIPGIASRRVTATKGKRSKEKHGPKQTKEKDGNLCSASGNPVGTPSRAMQAEDMRQYTYLGGSSTQPCGVPTVHTSVLPDLNTSAPASTLFHQPFSDLQQVQLRAQIFVYGSLIQGTAPDEACMISAFGGTSPDSGRSIWENVWRVSIERFHNQKSPLSNPDTPLHSRGSGIRFPEQASRSDPQGKTLGTPAGRTGRKGSPSTMVNPAMPLSSPVWNISPPRDGMQSNSLPGGPFLDSHQSLSPLHPNQSPHARHYVGNNIPWLSHASSPAPWVVSPQTPTLDPGVQYSALSAAEAVQVASVRDSSVPCTSSILPPSPLAPIGGPMTVSTGSAQKPRKRKKSFVTEEKGQVSVSQPRSEPASATGVLKNLTSSVGISSPAPPPSRVISGGFIPSTHFQVIGGGGTDQRVIFSEETSSKIEQAKLHADDAASLAAAAVRHSQSIWTQLAIQKNSGLVADVEAKLASAAVASAAAAAVAKAAAAAAKVASDAALQAKLMADEVLSMPRVGNFIQGSEPVVHDGGKNFGRITPASILKGKDKVNSSGSVIVTAREAARKRVESASAAAKRAENLDAVVKAAELAAEAVSQAGAIIAMGDPIPLTLSELVEAGPESYWKVQASTEHLVKANSICGVEQSNTDGGDEGLDRSIQHINNQPSNKKEKQRTAYGGKTPPKEQSRQSVENNTGLVNGMHLGSASSEKGLGGQKTRKSSDLAKTIGVIPESEFGSRAASLSAQNDEHERHQQAGTSSVNNIKEGTIVEVISDADGVRGVWYSANVLSLRDGKAYVCYNELLQDGGSDKLKEWIALEGKGGKAPRIRIPHPMTAMKFEGTRKRRREAMGNYVWSVGDRVDALIRDGWREGIVTEKNKEDETKLTVHFPAGGDSSTVRAWDLRPSLVWKDGRWMEWSTESNSRHHEGDTPQEKRLRMGGSKEIGADIQVEAQVKDKLPKDPRSEDSWSHMLSAKDKIFSIGKNVREQNNSDPLKVKRTGLQKEGSRVIFGVPKPGKKRKFMEVSKQYVAERTVKVSEGSDSIKFAKYLIPQASRGWKNTSKVDSKGKQAAELKPKVLRSGKAQNVQSKAISEKGSSSISIVSVSNEENNVQKKNLLESNNLKAADGPVLFSPLEIVSDAPSSKNKSSSAIEAEPGTKGKPASTGEKTVGEEEKGPSFNDHEDKSVSDAIEPRRSNRRIQPTSRLLEGLQSSLIVAKIPPLVHDRGSAKARTRNASSRAANNH
ncbi:G2484-1 protein isoform X3 [Tasmannia lanceolata]|uniref:G2484-1 protein isoform X3 n=1 Tax=Tasmannia lanceolata TaxID=3420 RepID=UPI004063E727